MDQAVIQHARPYTRVWYRPAIGSPLPCRHIDDQTAVVIKGLPIYPAARSYRYDRRRSSPTNCVQAAAPFPCPRQGLPVAAATRRPTWCILSFWLFTQHHIQGKSGASCGVRRQQTGSSRDSAYRFGRPDALRRHPIQHFISCRFGSRRPRSGRNRLGACVRPAAPRQRNPEARGRLAESRPSLQRQYPVACRRTACRFGNTASGYRQRTNAIQLEGAPKLASFTAERARMRVSSLAACIVSVLPPEITRPAVDHHAARGDGEGLNAGAARTSTIFVMIRASGGGRRPLQSSPDNARSPASAKAYSGVPSWATATRAGGPH